MKAEELMINDWVTSPGGNFQIKTLETPWSEELESGIQGIPLTFEIMEKNGWKERRNGFDIYYSRDEEPRCLIITDNHKEFSPLMRTINAYKPIKYVHELQHALRLAKLNDFADNLKL